jgi:copper chaperone CopZ
MKSIIKVCQINREKDVIDIQKVISQIEGIIASKISLEKKEIQVIYNENFVNLDNIIESIEDLGYIVI